MSRLDTHKDRPRCHTYSPGAINKKRYTFALQTGQALRRAQSSSTEHRGMETDTICKETTLISVKGLPAGASLAFDNCYEVWESGFISIPHDFTLDDLKPKLQLLLAAPHSQNGAPRVEPLTGLGELSGAGMLSRAGMQRSANAVLDKRHAKAHADRLSNGNEAHDSLSPEPHKNGNAQRQSSEGEKGSGEGGKPNNAKKWRRRRGKSKARMRLPRASPKLATDHHIASFISQEFTKVRWRDHGNDAPLILCASSQPAAQVRVLPPAIPFLRVSRYKQLFWPKVRGSLCLPLC